MFQPGDIVATKYRVERLLEVGGMGQVYVAINERLGKRIALKVLDKELLTVETAAERFTREAVAASSVRHPGVVDIYDADVLEDGRPWIAMELLEGESLQARLDRDRKVPLAEAIEIVSEALDVLAAVHGAGIIHRDLKPGNLFLVRLPDGRRRVKVLDFGIAKVTQESLGNLTRTGMAMGTPHYLSPEQASGMPVDGRTDVYAMGVVLFELISGERPYEDVGSFGELVKRIYTVGPRSLAQVVPGTPPAIVELIDRCLRVAVDARPASARDMLLELKRIPLAASGTAGTVALPPPGAFMPSTMPMQAQVPPPVEVGPSGTAKLGPPSAAQPSAWAGHGSHAGASSAGSWPGTSPNPHPPTPPQAGWRDPSHGGWSAASQSGHGAAPYAPSAQGAHASAHGAWPSAPSQPGWNAPSHAGWSQAGHSAHGAIPTPGHPQHAIPPPYDFGHEKKGSGLAGLLLGLGLVAGLVVVTIGGWLGYRALGDDDDDAPTTTVASEPTVVAQAPAAIAPAEPMMLPNPTPSAPSTPAPSIPPPTPSPAAMPTAVPVAALPTPENGCGGESIAGTWRATEYRNGKTTVWTLAIDRRGSRLNGRIVNRTWYGPRGSRPPPPCRGQLAYQVSMSATGSIEGRRVDFRGVGRWRYDRDICGRLSGYNLDHFAGSLDSEGRMTLYNDDGAAARGDRYRFRRTSCE